MSDITVTSSTMTAEQMAQTFAPAPVEPVETPPPADTPADEDTDPPTPAGQEQVSVPADGTRPPETERRVSRAQQRVNDALRDRKLAELERDKERAEKAQLADELAKLKATPPPTPVTPPIEAAPAQPEVVDDPEPKEDDFDDWSAFQRETAKWEGRQAARQFIANERAKAKDERDRLAAIEQRMTTARTYMQRADDVKKELPDFDEVVNREVRWHPVMSEVLLRSPIGPRLAYHFGGHPDDAARIAVMPADEMLTEMHRLEGRVSAFLDIKHPPPAAAVAPVPISSAPPPPPSLPGGAVVSVPTTRTARTFKEFEEAERREEAEKRRQRGL